MTVCPLEYRYGTAEMRRLFSRENLVTRMVEVELALLQGLASAGLAPEECGSIGGVTVRPSMLDEAERRIGHEVAALAEILAEKLGGCGKYVHLGATSNDIIDTAWALVLRDALSIIGSRLWSLIGALRRLAEEHMDTLMVGRTHGQHALPVTLGFKAANYVYEFSRSIVRLCEARRRVVLGKMSGAVGTMAAWGSAGLLVEAEALARLGLKPHPISTQVAPRDGYAELAAVLAILASQLDRLATEVRELSRPEIGELAEPGSRRRVGSSTMPHKSNPTLSERVSGLARIVRGLAVAGFENLVLWHERDLSNSSAERLLLPHMFMLVDQMLADAARIVEGLEVRAEAMRRNLELSRGAILSEAVMVKLVEKGVPRHEAHRLLRRLALRAEAEGKGFAELVKESPEVSDLLGGELDEILDPSNYLGMYRELVARAFEYAERAAEVCGYSNSSQGSTRTCSYST